MSHHVAACQSASHLACTHPGILALVVPVLILMAVGPFFILAAIEARRARKAGLSSTSTPSTIVTSTSGR